MLTAESQTIDPVPAVTLTDGELHFYQREGYLQIPGLLPSATADKLRDGVMYVMSQIGGYEGNKLKQSSEYLENSSLDAFVHSEQLRNVAGQLMGGPSSLYLPFTAVKGSGGGKFNFHQDNNYTHFDDGMKGINIWFALIDMTPENGCLMMVPRSHTGGQLESENVGDGHRTVKHEPKDFLPVRMRAGDAVAFSRLTVHGSGPNTTADPRVAYAVQYFRNDARYTDRETGELKSHLEFPRFANATRPVKKISVPTGKLDGH